MVNLRYVGTMAKGLAVAPGFKLSVVRGGVYDIPDKIAEQFLTTSNWESTSLSKKKKVKKTEEKIEAPIEVPEEDIIIDNIEEDE